MFIDSAKIFIKAGNGGNGVVSFHREKYVAAGGPDGGDGGKGGDIIFIVDENIRTLQDFRYRRQYKAESGKDGAGANRSGRSGSDMIVKVPAGTIVRDEESGRIIADLVKPDQSVIIAKGGKGGKGNQHFATPTRQIPTFAKSGELGEERWITMELKLLADVGLIGFPNVGKSTMLSSVSAATPKIADYHFTTLEPNLGVVSLDKGNSFVIADIPGLIEGAHKGIGLGHDFLKHIERTRLLIHVVDMPGTEGRDPLNDFRIINKELEEYSKALAQKPQIVAANKMDVTNGEENFETFKKVIEAEGYKVFPVSSATGKGLKELMYYAGSLLSQLPETPLMDTSDTEEMVYTVEEEKPFEIRKEGEVYIVEGNWVRRIVGSVNLDNHESLQYFQRAIKSIGIVDELEKMGINEGDTVKFYDVEFEYIR